MRPLLAFLVIPVASGLASVLLLRNLKHASFAATIAAPLLIYVLVRLIDPSDPWSALATLLLSPLAVALAVITVFVWAGRARARRRPELHDT